MRCKASYSFILSGSLTGPDEFGSPDSSGLTNPLRSRAMEIARHSMMSGMIINQSMVAKVSADVRSKD